MLNSIKAVCLLPFLASGLLFAGFAGAETLTLNEVAKQLLASDAESYDHFGDSIAVDGDTAVIGTSGDDDKGENSGAAYIFTRDSSGLWSEQQKLTAGDGEGGDGFGRSVAVSGNSVAIVAPGDNSGMGTAYVFTRDETGNWSQQQKLIPSDSEGIDAFGFSVALDEDIVAIGAPGDYGTGPYDYYAGSVYVFTYDDGIWTEERKLTASDGGAYGQFGSSLSVADETIMIGSQAGVVYVFTRNESAWEEQILAAEDTSPGDFFGTSVAMDGNTAVIGAPYDLDNGFLAGSVYVFIRDDAGDWIEQQELYASDISDTSDLFDYGGDEFGWYVAVNGDTLVIGAIGDDDNNDYKGSAYLFTHNDGVWTEQVKLIASDGNSTSSRFAVTDSAVMFGIPGQDTAAGIDAGAVYVFNSDCVSSFCITDAAWTYKNFNTGWGFLDISGFSPFTNDSISIVNGVTGEEVFNIRSKPDGTFTTTSRRGMFDYTAACSVQAVAGVDVSNVMAVANVPEDCVGPIAEE